MGSSSSRFATSSDTFIGQGFFSSSLVDTLKNMMLRIVVCVCKKVESYLYFILDAQHGAISKYYFPVSIASGNFHQVPLASSNFHQVPLASSHFHQVPIASGNFHQVPIASGYFHQFPLSL